jgi:hypothetical protein
MADFWRISMSEAGKQTQQNVTNTNGETAITMQLAPAERTDEVALLRQTVKSRQHEI